MEASGSQSALKTAEERVSVHNHLMDRFRNGEGGKEAAKRCREGVAEA
jgi:hypothetical protein